MQKKERKILDGEFPHQLYIQNYLCASSSCLVLRKWIFDPDRERQLCQRDPVFRQFIFKQAVADVNEGRLKSCQKMYQLKAIQNEGNANEFLEMTRGMVGYNEVVFPPCCCPTRKAGDVIMVVRFASLLLTSNPPNPEIQVDFNWDDIIEYRVEDGGRAFQFVFKREGKPAKPIKLLSNYADYMAECFEQVLFERQVASNWKSHVIKDSTGTHVDNHVELQNDI